MTERFSSWAAGVKEPQTISASSTNNIKIEQERSTHPVLLVQTKQWKHQNM